MPNLNGEELAREIKVSRPDIQILMITRVLRRNDFATEAIRRYPLLEKPFRLSTLLEVVENCSNPPQRAVDTLGRCSLECIEHGALVAKPQRLLLATTKTRVAVGRDVL